MSNRNLTDKEIQTYKIRSIIFLTLMIIGFLTSFYLYLDVQGHHIELDKKNTILEHQRDSLKEANERILKQSNTIVNLKEHQRQGEQLKEAIGLVQILVNKDADTQMNTDEILAGLTEMAEEEKTKQAEYKKERADLIVQLFTKGKNNRQGNLRDNARRNLSKKHGTDIKLVSRLLDYMDNNIYTTNGNKKTLNPAYKESIYQTLYLFTTLSAQNLVPEKDRIEQFFKAVKVAIPYGPTSQTKRQIDETLNKLKSV